jgi:predicted component of type VI protein secretion system
MYKNLSYLEKDIGKRISMLEKRRGTYVSFNKELLEPIKNAINAKAYKAYYEKLLVELAEIYNEEFEAVF